MPQDDSTRLVAVEGFARAARLREHANRLPRRRWWKRRRLLAHADIIERGVSLFWRDHADDLP